MVSAWVHAYLVGNLPNDTGGVIRLETSLDKWKIFNDLLEIFGINFALNRRAVARLWSVVRRP